MPEMIIQEKTYQFPEGATIIGRNDDADITIDSTKLSRAHARFVIEGGRIFIQDLGSKNGTFVNGTRIEGKKEILKGDQVKIADIDVQIIYPGAAKPVQRPRQAPKPSLDKAARRSQRKQKEMIKKVVVLAVLAVVGLAGFSYYKNYIPKEQKQAREIVAKAEENISSVEVSNDLEKNMQAADRLSALKVELNGIAEKYKEEFSKAAEFNRKIEQKLNEIGSKSSLLRAEQESIKLFDDICGKISLKSISPAEAVSSLENIMASYPGTEACQKASEKIRELEGKMLEEEKKVIAQARTEAQQFSEAGRFSEALSVIEECAGRQFRKVSEAELAVLEKDKKDIHKKAKRYFEDYAERTVSEASTEDCEKLEQALRNKFDRIGITEFEDILNDAVFRIDEIKAGRIARAKAKLKEDLAGIDGLEKKRKYEKALSAYRDIIEKIIEQELKKEVEKKKRFMSLLNIAKKGIIKFVKDNNGMDVTGFGFIQSMDDQEIMLQIEGKILPLGWDKIRDSEFRMLLSRAASRYADADLYLSCAVLMMKNDPSKADEYMAKAVSASSDIASSYPDLFSAYKDRSAKREEEEKKQKAEIAEQRKKKKAGPSTAYIPERPWTVLPEMRLSSVALTSNVMTPGPLKGPIENELKGVHPRIFITREKLEYLKKNGKGGKYAKMYDMLMIKARKGLRTDPPDSGRDSIDDEGEQLWQSQVGDMIIQLSLAYLLTGNKQFFEQAKRYIEKCFSYPVWGERFKGADLAAAHQCGGIGIAYDWLFHDLTPEERTSIYERLYERGKILTDAGARGIWWAQAYTQNHLWVDCAGMAIAAFAICDEKPEAKAWIHYAHRKFLKSLEVLFPDGASQEGYGYWMYGVNHVMQYMELSHDLLGIDLYHSNGIDHPWIVNNILYAAYMMTPTKTRWKHQIFNYGDNGPMIWHGPNFILRNIARRFPDQKNAGIAQWVARDNESREDEGSFRHHLNFLWFDPSIPEVPVNTLPLLHHFTDLDIVVSRSGWDRKETVLSVKCGPPEGHGHMKKAYGVGHVHPDAGHFLLHGRGEILVRDDGYSLTKVTSAHNTILVNGKGQVGEGAAGFNFNAFKSAGGTPKILFAEQNGNMDIIVCDVTKAYTGAAALKTFRRTFCFAKPDAILITDILIAERAVEFDWRLNLEGTLEKKTDWYYCLTKNNVCLDIGIIRPQNANISIIGVTKLDAWTGEQTAPTPALSIKPLQKTARGEFVVLLRVRNKGDNTPFAPVLVKQNVRVQTGNKVVELVTSRKKDTNR